MRIAINARFLLPGRLEGFGWYTHELVGRMARNHPEDQFLLLFDRPYAPQFLYSPNCYPRVLFPQARHPLLWEAWFEYAVPRALRKFNAEVFFSPDTYCSLSTDVPTVMTVHDLGWWHHPERIPSAWARRYLKRRLPQFLARADRLVTISRYVAQDLAQTTGVSPEKITVIHNGCREGFRPFSEPEKAAVRAQYAGGHDYFFYTGAIHPRKNIHRLIRAFDQFKTTTGAPTRLLLAGRMAWMTEEVESAHRSAHSRDDVHFLGYVPESELVRLMAAARALTYVSLDEGFGLPLLEAMHTDTPVITSNVSALPEVAGDAALLVDPLDEAAIARALERVYAEDGLAADLAAKGRIQRALFSWDRAAEQLYDLLTEVARTGRANAGR